VNYAVSSSGAVPVDASDFSSGTLPSGTVTFSTGQSNAVVTIRVSGDTLTENDEGFLFTLSNAVNATLLVSSAGGTILNDDNIVVANLPSQILGLASESTHTIWLSNNAAGAGWFVDQTTMQGLGFNSSSIALPLSAATNRVDLLTVVSHELGHVLGLGDLEATIGTPSTMTESLAAGIRRIPGSLTTGATLGGVRIERLNADAIGYNNH
jgi:hypothetical protein